VIAREPNVVAALDERAVLAILLEVLVAVVEAEDLDTTVEERKGRSRDDCVRRGRRTTTEEHGHTLDLDVRTHGHSPTRFG
jgi:hypothetical protein